MQENNKHFTVQADEPKTLLDPLARRALLEKLFEPHVRPLTEFVETIRSETKQYERIPYFDPSDGGIYAKCLFLFETPGPGAVCSGFISRNNPDETAKNFFELSQKVGLTRKLTILWNIVPWYLGKGNKDMPDDIVVKGQGYLKRLLLLLPHLRVIVLAGRTAQKNNHSSMNIVESLACLTRARNSLIGQKTRTSYKFGVNYRKYKG